MLTTIDRGQSQRQWVFFGFLFLPIFILMFILGVMITRSVDLVYPVAITLGIMAIIGSLVTVGINWRIGLYMIMFFVLWDRLLAFNQSGSINATKLAIGMTIVYMMTAMFNGQLPGWGRRMLDPLVFAGVMFVAVTAFSAIFMPHPETAITYISRRTNIVVVLLIFMIGVNNRDTFHRAILFLVIGGTLVALVTLSEPITGKGLLERLGKAKPDIGSGINVLQTYRGAFRIIGPSGGPNFYGLAQSLPAVLAFGLLLYYRDFWKKALLTVALGLMVFNIMGTGSRSGVAGFVFGVAAIFMLCPVKHRMIKMAVAVTVLVVGVFVLVALDTNVAANRLTDTTGADHTAANRMALWQMAADMWTNHPWTGVGPNGWSFNYSYYRLPPLPDRLLRTHNSFMQMFAECGVQGVLVYVSLFFFAGLSSFSAAFGTRDRRLKFEAMSFASILIGFFMFAGSQNVLEHELYFIVFGMCGASYNVYRRECEGLDDLGSDQLLPLPELVRIARQNAKQKRLFPCGT